MGLLRDNDWPLMSQNITHNVYFKKEKEMTAGLYLLLRWIALNIVKVEGLIRLSKLNPIMMALNWRELLKSHSPATSSRAPSLLNCIFFYFIVVFCYLLIKWRAAICEQLSNSFQNSRQTHVQSELQLLYATLTSSNVEGVSCGVYVFDGYRVRMETQQSLLPASLIPLVGEANARQFQLWW